MKLSKHQRIMTIETAQVHINLAVATLLDLADDREFEGFIDNRKDYLGEETELEIKRLGQLIELLSFDMSDILNHLIWYANNFDKFDKNENSTL